MTTRRPIHYRPVLQPLLATEQRDAPMIELGWCAIIDELRDAGWPSHTPTGDRKPRTTPPDTDPDALDYRDPTGDNITNYERLHADRKRLETIRQQREQLNREALHIAARHAPKRIEDPDNGRTLQPTPACACGSPVEARKLKTGGYSYVGMMKLADVWVAKQGIEPRCDKCRKRHERGAA